MATHQSTCTGKAIVIAFPPDFTHKELVVEIDIACADCGGVGTIRLPGHHLRAIRDLLTEFCDAHPDLTKANPRTVTRTTFAGLAPADPSEN